LATKRHEFEDEDTALFLRFQNKGDFGAFEQLFMRHKENFIHYLWRLSSSPSIAEDISQQCWLKLIELAGKKRFQKASHKGFKAYLYTMGRNYFLDQYVRKHEVSRTEELTDLSSSNSKEDLTDSPERQTQDRQRTSILNRVTNELPLEQRDVIALWAAGASIKDICAITNAPRNTVLSRKKYALTKLRTSLAAGEQNA